MPPTPQFIALDGIDGTGKSTQCRLLADWLNSLGVATVTAVDPGGTPLGSRIRELLLFGQGQNIVTRAEALLFMASRAQLVETVIRPALAQGQWVVSDRFLLSNVVYQGYGGGLDPEELWEVGQLATGGLMPDHNLLLDIPLQVAASRMQRPLDQMESRSVEYRERIRQGFLTEAGKWPERVVVIDARQEVDAVQQSIRQQLRTRLEAAGVTLPESQD